MKRFLKKITISFFMIVFIFSSLSLLANTETEIIYSETDVAGTYPIKVRYRSKNGSVTEETFYVTVTFPRTVVAEKYGEAIDAHDIKVQEGLFEQLSDDDLIMLTKAHAWNTRNGEPVGVVSVIKKQHERLKNNHEITFATANGTNTTVHLLEEKKLPEKVSVNSMYLDIDHNLKLSFLQLAVIIIWLALLFLFYFNYRLSQKKIKRIESLLNKTQKSK